MYTQYVQVTMLFIVCFSQLSPELQVKFVLPSHSLLLRHARVGFRHWYVDHSGSCYEGRPSWPYVSVVATPTVSYIAHYKVRYTFLTSDNSQGAP
jgi:hypothetical protein